MGFSLDTLQDRVVIVTGASQGIGRAIAVGYPTEESPHSLGHGVG